MENKIAVKNELLITKKSQNNKHKNLYLALSVALMLGGCETTTSMMNNITGERSSGHSSGSRRVPALNNGRVAPAPVRTQPEAGSVAPAPRVEQKPATRTAADSPYDQYDENGNEVAAADDSSGGSDFFSDWFGFGKPSPQQPDVKQSGSHIARKPLPGNPALAKNISKGQVAQPAAKPLIEHSEFNVNTVEPAVEQPVAQEAPKEHVLELPVAKETPKAPVVETPVVQESPKAPVVETPVVQETPKAPVVETPVVQETSKAPVVETPVVQETPRAPALESTEVGVAVEPAFEQQSLAKEVAEEAGKEQQPVQQPVQQAESENVDKTQPKETLLGRIGSKLNIFDSKKKSEPQQAYPEISSVPPKPEEFEAIKQDKQQNFNNLQFDTHVAEQEKQSLDSEVSGVPVPPVAATVEPPVVSKPAVSTAISDSSDKVSPPLPVQGQDLSEKPVAVEEAPKAPVAETPAVETPVVQESPKAPAVETPVVQETPPVAASVGENEQVSPAVIADTNKASPLPVSSLQEVDVKTSPMQPAMDNSPAPVQSAVEQPVAEQSDEGQADNGSSGSQPASKLLGAESLPSPDIIKTMRPSRYDIRKKQAQNYDY